MRIELGTPNIKQERFLLSKKKIIGFGGARGGGKSWAVRFKAKALAAKYSGIKILIVRRTYPELINNHINILRKECLKFAKYNDKDKVLKFKNGSTINFTYCANDKDLDRLQGQEYDAIFIDEATQLSEYQIKCIMACNRGVNDFPKRTYMTCNPGGQGHAYIKRIFIDKRYEKDENPDDYDFIQSLVSDNKVLMESDAEYVQHLEALPPKLKKAWLYGDWDIYEGQFFEDFVNDPEHYDDRTYTNVINPFEIPKSWKIYRSYDFGYNKPFSCAWWAVDYDGVIYRILELYGCTGEPNVGVKWTPDTQFKKIREIENEHRWLKGKDIYGVADPSCWDTSRGVSVAETAEKYGIYFDKGDNSRISGWLQCHYRLAFDDNGYPQMYVFNTCKGFLRTIPTLMYSDTKPEDLDTSLEDHIADEWRYFCMSRPIKPVGKKKHIEIGDDPLNMMAEKYKNYRRY